MKNIDMTEKEKMLAGMIYDANNDPGLAEERMMAKDLCHQFNNIPPSDLVRQREILSRLLGKTHGDNFTILPTFWCDYGYNIEIGANFFANHNTVILDGAKVKFGDNVFIAPNCSFYTAGHSGQRARVRRPGKGSQENRERPSRKVTNGNAAERRSHRGDQADRPSP